jgi:CBS domain containing-hemolysin-like protein
LSDTGEPRVVEDWRPFVRRIPVLPSSSTIENALQELRRYRQEMAILVDEYGGTDGIVTVTAVARFTMGHSKNLRRIARGRFLVAGHVGLAVLDAALGVSFHDEDSGIETVGGLIMERLDRVPEPNDQVTIDGVSLRVVSMDGRRVEQVLVQLPATEDPVLPDRPTAGD